MSKCMNSDRNSHAEMPPVQDRRAHSRISMALPCEIRTGQTTRKATLVRLSLSGAFIASSYTPASGEHVTIVIPSRGRTGSLTLTGEVVRSGFHFSQQVSSRGFGIHFQRAGSDLLLLIRDAMAGNAHRQGGGTAKPP